MIAECKDCGLSFSRYMCNTYSDPCSRCGSVIFYVFHSGVPWMNIPADRELMNVVTHDKFGREIAHYHYNTTVEWIPT